MVIRCFIMSSALSTVCYIMYWALENVRYHSVYLLHLELLRHREIKLLTSISQIKLLTSISQLLEDMELQSPLQGLLY